MKCDKARELMSAAVDSELTSRENQAFTLHLQECSDCREEFEEAKKNKADHTGKNCKIQSPAVIDKLHHGALPLQQERALNLPTDRLNQFRVFKMPRKEATHSLTAIFGLNCMNL